MNRIQCRAAAVLTTGWKRITALILAVLLSISTCAVWASASVTGYANEDIIYAYLTDTLGLNCAAACAVLGNMRAETGTFNPTAYNKWENAWGICQWEGGRLTRMQERYPDTWKTLDAQLCFLRDELNGVDYSGPRTYVYLKSLPDTTAGARAGAQYFAQYFERCASSTYKVRQSYAAAIHEGRHGGAGYDAAEQTSLQVFPVTDLTDTQATVNALCSFEGIRPTETELWIGTDPSNMIKTQVQSADKTRNPYDIWFDLTGLAPGTTYYYQLCILVGGSAGWSEFNTFRTTGTPVPGSACAHKWGAWETVADAGCLVQGTRSRTCTICHLTEAGTSPALGHSFENGACVRCGEKDPSYRPEVRVHFKRTAAYLQGQFTDVPDGKWFTPYVSEAFEFGLMKGTAPKLFNPKGTVTLAEAVTMAARIHSIYTTGKESFVQSGKWYQVYLDYALKNGIVPASYRNADMKKVATRFQFAEIFAGALPSEALPEINLIYDNAIPDVKKGSAYAEPVYRLYRAGILAGSDAKGTFFGKSSITRAESSAVCARMAEYNNRFRWFS